MKVINCIWELNNLGEKTAEINIEKDDVFSEQAFLDIIYDYDYIVVKVPVDLVSFNFGLSKLGFTMIETQINISKLYKNFNFEDRLIKVLYPHVRLEEIKSQTELNTLFSMISDDMFSTDRISLDLYFQSGLSSHRYKNWIKTEYENQTSIVSKIMYDDKCVGFSMDKVVSEGVYSGLLGGIFKKYQSEGFALCNGGIRFIDSHKKNKPFKKMKTAISSNNLPVVEVFNYLGYKIDNLSYVFVKHLKK